MQKCYCRPLKWPAIFRGQGCPRSNLYTRCPLPLTPSNVPTKFHWNNQNRFGEKCKNAISHPKMATIPRGQYRLKSNSRTRYPLPLVMSLPSFVRISKIDLEKSAKMWFFRFKIGAVRTQLVGVCNKITSGKMYVEEVLSTAQQKTPEAGKGKLDRLLISERSWSALTYTGYGTDNPACEKAFVYVLIL